MAEFRILEVPTELEPLFKALVECGKRYPRIRSHRVLGCTMERLTCPPASFQIPPASITDLANSLLKHVLNAIDDDPFNDIEAPILRLNEGQSDPNAKWKRLSRAERKRAHRLSSWALDTGLGAVTQRGRPTKIDPALVLYCARVIAVGCGQTDFKFSRPHEGGRPTGPMWRALMAALPLAQTSLARGDAPTRTSASIGRQAEAVAYTLKIARSQKFRTHCWELGLGSDAGDVEEHPETFRLALASSRSLRERARRK
jgi:hypothetical protein